MAETEVVPRQRLLDIDHEQVEDAIRTFGHDMEKVRELRDFLGDKDKLEQLWQEFRTLKNV